MNYTKSHQMLSIIDAVLPQHDMDARTRIAQQLEAEADEQAMKAVDMVETEDSWQVTPSESDFISALRGVAALLRLKDVENANARLSDMADMIRTQMPKIKIAFFTQEYFLWPSFESVWTYMRGLDNVETRLVYVYSNVYSKAVPAKLKDQKYLENISAFKNNGYPILEMENFDMSVECPDMVFYMKPYHFRGCPDKFYVNEIVKHTPYTVYISYCLDVQGGQRLFKFFYAEPAFYHMWKIIGYSKYYMDMLREYGFQGGENTVLIGHPKFDTTYNVLTLRSCQHEEWKRKIAGRPVVFWNSHFSVEPDKGVGTYYIWKDTIFGYFEDHHDVVLLWRPHPIFWEHIRKQPGFKPAEFNAMLNHLRSMDNVIVDDSQDYRYAFSMSDALISDAATFLVEFSASGLPVLYTPKKGGEFIINEDYLVGMETATKEEEIIRFLDRVKTGDQTGADIRKAHFREQFGDCDGKIGQRICEYLLTEMDADCVRRADQLTHADTGREQA